MRPALRNTVFVLLASILAPALHAAAPVAVDKSNAAKVETTTSHFAVIDVQRILQESLAARSVQKQLETQRAKFQAEIAAREQDLHASDTALKEARNSRADESLGEREQQLRQKFLSVERDVQNRRHALDQGFSKAMDQVRETLLAVVQNVAKANKAEAVLLKQQVLWHDPKLDITDEVLKQLNTQMTHVPVKIDLTPPATQQSEDKAP
jgi:outer membrane protein